ncbi:MAG: sigma-54-dependent transcriptional regulator [Longimicrobiales bacterium]
MARVLCVDDERAALEALEGALSEVGHVTVGVRNMEAALNVLDRGGVDLVVSDYRMPGGSGVALLQALRERGLEVPLIMVTGHGSIEHAVTAMKEGAADYITKPWTPEELRIATDQALEVVRLRKENAHLRDEISKLKSGAKIVGESEILARVLDTIGLVAPTRSTILLQGESGTGKEVLARTIHEQSDRRDGPFISINCAAMPENLVESTLFGHERGAFTGAHRRVAGAFERADRGTLLLDEVTEMRLETQAKLLRVLQEQEFERVGGTQPLKVDVRILATTNRDMKELVDSGQFREDLFYRLSVVPLRVPPLRERTGDIPLLVHHFVEKAALEMGRQVPSITIEAMDLLLAHRWPGNVRELAHSVERAVIFEPGLSLSAKAFRRTGVGGHGGSALNGTLSREVLLLDNVRGLDGPREGTEGEGAALEGVFLQLNSHRLGEAEDELIRLAMSASDDNKTHAADLLGINVRTLRKKLNQPADTTKQVPIDAHKRADPGSLRRD